jgi:hypothetical protein
MMALAVSATVASQPARGLKTRGQDPVPPPHVTFNDNDRQVTRTWFEAHQKDLPAGFKASDRLSPEIERQFQQGFVIDKTLQSQLHPVPSTLLHLLAPPPGVYRYAIVGGHLVLIDDSYRVLDLIHVNHDR